jgi:hypothetical protein
MSRKSSFRSLLRRAYGPIDERAFQEARERSRSLAECGQWVAPNLTEAERAYIEQVFAELRAEQSRPAGKPTAGPG